MQADAHATLGLIIADRGLDEAAAHFKEAIRLARKDPAPEGHFTLGRSLNNMASIHLMRGEHDEAVHLFLECLDLERRVRDINQVAFMNLQLGVEYISLGDWQAAKVHLADNPQLPTPLGRIYQSQSLLRMMEGDPESAASLSGDAAKYYRQTGNLQEISRSCTILAWANLELGRNGAARDAASESASSMGRLPWRWTTAFMLSFVLEGLARGGDFEHAEALCSDLEEISERRGSSLGIAMAQFGRAVLAFEQGHDRAAIGLIDEVLPVMKSLPLLHSRLLHTLARALAKRGDHADIERAKGAVQECLRLLTQMGDTRKAEQVRAEFASLA